ncbi:MAG: TetR family transcriptional regulator [Actinobacteria bacterium]|nr:TetR family transcriptional regulator [Actinomycetota bacterium]
MAGDSPPRRPRRRPGENRERLIEAGIAEFGARGYHGASTAAIAALADVPQPHVYASFRTKQDLFLACAERVADGPSGLAELGSAVEAFLLQAVAALGEPQRREELLPVLRPLRLKLGAELFNGSLARAARDALRE